jgi:hypothetical protein
MALINTARAMDSDRFRWRVTAAVLQVASDKINSTDPVEKTYAQYILDNPMVEQRTFTALCAVNPAIASQVTVVDDDSNTVDTDAVPDEDLVQAVTDSWITVAQRYGGS